MSCESISRFLSKRSYDMTYVPTHRTSKRYKNFIASFALKQIDPIIIYRSQNWTMDRIRESVATATEIPITETETRSSNCMDVDVAAENENEEMTVLDDDVPPPTSALQDNIARKGKNAYYFAHAHKANGPKWDGKAEPRLLKRHSSSCDDYNDKSGADKMNKAPSFLYHKSNITSYAFLNEEKCVKLYIPMEEVGEKCTPDDISLEWEEQSFSLVVRNFMDDDHCLSFGKLSGKIVDASFKLKANKIILTLTKEKEGVEWYTIGDKGTPDHELV
jgi:hypothetical protein